MLVLAAVSINGLKCAKYHDVGRGGRGPFPEGTLGRSERSKRNSIITFTGNCIKFHLLIFPLNAENSFGINIILSSNIEQ